MRRPRVTGSEAWDDRSRTLRRVVFGFKIFGRRSGPLIEVDVDALANAAAMKMASSDFALITQWSIGGKGLWQAFIRRWVPESRQVFRNSAFLYTAALL